MKNLPDKIYMKPRLEQGGVNIMRRCSLTPTERHTIEYVRKDAFVEKALKFLDEYFFFNNRRYSIECGEFDSKEEMIEDFKKYIED